MAVIALILDDLLGGFVALISGIESSLSSTEIRAAYARFGTRFLVITALGYLIISATMMSLVPVAFILSMGPILGPIIFLAFCWIAFMVLLVLWVLGHFPKSLFTGSYGILRPFFSVNQISFLLTSLLVPMDCDKFMLFGIDIVCKEKGRDSKKIQSEYINPSLTKTLKLVCCNAMFAFVFRIAVNIMTLGLFGTWLDPVITSFLIGCQIVSVYNVRIRNASWKSHISWCYHHPLRIIGFSLPLQMVCGLFGWAGTVVWLGLGYSAAAPLVQDLIYEAIEREDIP
uniref:Uncharacterized protein n=1 Tax=Helicotheca tamesis TaxID=374047 RepID=A0A7S2DYK2_9STRA